MLHHDRNFFSQPRHPPVPPKTNPPFVYTLLTDTGAPAIHTDKEVVYSAYTVTDTDGSTRLLIKLHGFLSAADAQLFLHDFDCYMHRDDLDDSAPRSSLH